MVNTEFGSYDNFVDNASWVFFFRLFETISRERFLPGVRGAGWDGAAAAALPGGFPVLSSLAGRVLAIFLPLRHHFPAALTVPGGPGGKRAPGTVPTAPRQLPRSGFSFV